jgi:hypothetical protein
VTTRVLVAAMVLLAAAAAGDALRGSGADGSSPHERAPVPEAERRLVGQLRSLFRPGGARLDDRVLYAGREYLGSKAIADAFPSDVRGPVHIAKLTVARDGTLALGVYRFPSGRPFEGAVELWRRRRLVGAFRVPDGYFGGGLALSRDARYVATFSHDGQLRAVFDRTGRRLSHLPDSFLYVD